MTVTDVDATPALRASPARLAAAAALRELNEAFLAHDADPALLDGLAASAGGLAARLRAGEPRRRTFAEIVAEQDAPVVVDGGRVDVPDQDFLTGAAHPASVPADHLRDGEDVVVRTRIGVAHEGMPGFAHGGILMALFDNLIGMTMGRMRRTPAPTVRVEVSFHRPVPLDRLVELRARPVGADGRKRTVEAELTVDGVVHASATGLLVLLDAAQLASGLGGS